MDEADFSKAIEQVQKMLEGNEGQNSLQNIISMLSGNSDDSNSESDSSVTKQNASPPSPSSVALPGSDDLEMIMKMQKLLSMMNSSSSSAEVSFLNALKPFLKNSRRQSVEQAIKLMSISRAFKLLKETEKGGG